MKGSFSFKKIVTTSWFLAVIPAAMIVLFTALKYPGNLYLTILITSVAAYPLFLGFVLIVKKTTVGEISEMKKAEIRDMKLNDLKIKSLRAQIDPHFIFNILNSVASLIYLDDRQKAYDYMNKFTQLLRTIYNESDSVYRSLGDEIDVVSKYLELERMRFGNKFNYNISLGKGISREEIVPRLFIQTFAEYIINHNLAHNTEGGLLTIRVEKESDYVKAFIEDNGNSDLFDKELLCSVKRMNLTRDLFELMNKMGRKPIKYHFEAIKTDEGQFAGTRTEVWVPVGEISLISN